MKKGMSHLEIILGFFLFLGAVVLGLTYTSPFGHDILPSAASPEIFESIRDFAAIPVDVYTIIINSGNIPSGRNTILVNLTFAQADNRTIHVETIKGLNIPARIIPESEASAIYASPDCAYINWTPAYGEILTLYLGKGIPQFRENDVDTGSAQLDTTFYNLSATYRDSVLIENKLLMLRTQYLTDYEVAKSTFSIPNNLDFAFDVIFPPNRSIQANKEIVKTTEVYTRNERMEILADGGNRTWAELRVSVW